MAPLRPGRPLFSPAAADGEAGFTLIEALISMVLLGFLISGLYGLFSAAQQIWRRAETTFTEEQQIRLVRRRLTLDLENMAPAAQLTGNGPSAGEITGGRVQWLTASPEGWPGSVGLVSYIVDEQGLTRVMSWPPELQLSDSEAGEVSGVAEWRHILSDMVRALKPEVYIDGEWRELGEDEGGGARPEMVGVTFFTGREDEGEEDWRAHRVVVVPRLWAALAARQEQ